MSGIGGWYARTGQPLQQETLRAMLSALAHRGPDAADVWHAGPVGFVYALLYDTPESFHEQQPYHEHGFCITADARIDNRAELANAVGIDLHALPEIPDSRLILAAYLKWGRECPAHLLGDFAFAIWDPSRQEVFCARDPFGVKPFYYTLTAEYFAFGSEMKAIRCAGHAPNAINEKWLAQFFIPQNDFLDKASTIYDGVYRLEPAHWLAVTAAGHTAARYWQLDPERETHFQREDDYIEAMREQFTLAVGRRLRSAYPVGATLSGGLDSSSIAATARDLLAAGPRPPLHTFSAIFRDAPDADESPYIEAVVQQGGVEAHRLYPDKSSPFIDLERVLWHLDEPFYGTNYFMPWMIYRSAQEHGVRALLDGTDGDSTISHGMDYLDLLAMQASWKQFAHEAHALSEKFNHPRYATAGQILAAYGAPQFTSLLRKGRWIAFMRQAGEVGNLFHVSPRRVVLEWGLKPLLPKTLQPGAPNRRGGWDGSDDALAPPVTAEFIQSLRRQGYFQEIRDAEIRQTGRARHFRQLNLGMLPYTLELTNRMAAAFSVDIRFPFCDRDLVAFSLSVPPNLKLKDARSRYILRKAMSGTLPEKVQWRGGKISLAKVYPYMLRRSATEYVTEALMHPPVLLEKYINMAAVQAAYRQFLQDGNPQGLEWVWQTVVFSTWMKQNKNLSLV